MQAAFVSAAFAMNREHALLQVRQLRSHIDFLWPLTPNNPSYLLWIGDIAELANTIWGIGASEPLLLAEVLRPHVGEQGEGGRNYLERLRAIDAVLAIYEDELSAVD